MSEQQPLPGGQPPAEPPRWQDEAGIDAAWSAPAAAERADDGPGLPTPVKAGIVILALALVIGGIWALGGFETRTNLQTPVAAGEQVTSGPFELAFTDATAQKVKNWDDEIIWKVRARGVGRTTGDESISPDMNMFAARDPNTVESAEASRGTIGASEGSLDEAANFTPGLESVPYQVEVEFSKFYEPGDTIKFGVFVVEYKNAMLLDTGEKTWRPTPYVSVYNLPLEILPEDLD